MCIQGLNHRSLIQPSETLPVELTGTHSIPVYRFKVIALSIYILFIYFLLYWLKHQNQLKHLKNPRYKSLQFSILSDIFRKNTYTGLMADKYILYITSMTNTSTILTILVVH